MDPKGQSSIDFCKVARLARVERAACGFEVRRSIQLSYRRSTVCSRHNQHLAKAWSRSAMMSSGFSIPTAILTNPGVIPTEARSFSE